MKPLHKMTKPELIAHIRLIKASQMPHRLLTWKKLREQPKTFLVRFAANADPRR